MHLQSNPYFVLSICTVSRTCMCLFFQPHHRLDVDFLLSVCLAHLRMFLPHHRHDVGFRLCGSCAACLYACSSTICHLPLLACLGHQHGSDISFSSLCCARLVRRLDAAYFFVLGCINLHSWKFDLFTMCLGQCCGVVSSIAMTTRLGRSALLASLPTRLVFYKLCVVDA